MKYYSLNRILKKNATYNIIMGERSNGKTFAILDYAVKRFFEGKGQVAIVRRWAIDLQGRRASAIFSAINESGLVLKYSKGKYSNIHYWSGKFYVCNVDEKGKAIYNEETDLLGYTFALSESEHNKSISYPNITTIFFDEFITNNLYLTDEFIIFMNTLSTIIRQRDNVKIFMAGNTVNKYNPYFEEMGLKHAGKMEQGSIDLYRYGNTSLTVAIEYCASAEKEKKSNFYFAFNNPKLQMITKGSWELDIFPHLPKRYKPNQILFTFFILFDGSTYQGEVIDWINGDVGIYIHVKTSPLKDMNHDLIYSLDYSPKLNYNKTIGGSNIKADVKIGMLFKLGKVTYQNNDVGNAIQNYIKLSR